MRPFKFTAATIFTAVLMMLVPVHGASFNTIYTFTDSCLPSELTFDKDGNLYGATTGGAGYGPGNIFELTRSQSGWTKTILYSFKGGADGEQPSTGLIFDEIGNLYGTTGLGGLGYGTVFKLTPGVNGWTKTTLYSFKGPFIDGFSPTKVVLDKQGNIYGSTYFGGVNNNPVCFAGHPVGCGTVFELSPANGQWMESSLFSFDAEKDGWFPSAPPLVASDGKLYVTARTGACCKGGTLLQLTSSPSGWTERAFLFNHNTGEGPTGDLLVHGQAAYGVTQSRGPNGGGTVYQVDLKKNVTVLYSFSQNGSDGFAPGVGLTLLNNGLYGTTIYGGSNNTGTIYQLTPSVGQWTENVLYSFPGGGSPQLYPSKLIADGQGNLYGTTELGGTSNCGTAFEITP